MLYSAISVKLKVPLDSELCFSYCYVTVTLRMSRCRMMYMQSQMLEDCFHIHLLKILSLSELTINLSLRHAHTSMIY